MSAAEDLTFLATTDHAGITRGRAIPRRAFETDPGRTVGWVPANISLTPFDVIADPNPWGSRGDLRLLPDPAARFSAHPPGAATPLDLVMCDIVETDGTPWCACPRTFLKDALLRLRDLAGFSLCVAFEHEFRILGAGWAAAPVFSLAALRRADPFGPELTAALAEAGLGPETFIAEYGRDQFEVTVAPADGLAAADAAVAVRETTRELARLRGWRASFAPKTEPAGVGNGVHVHLSLVDAEGRPATYDAGRPGRLSRPAGAFAAGVLRHLPALAALTAPSPVSYLRLVPHHWSSAWTWLGERDREASLRICPTVTLGGRDPAPQLNLEYRAADACACPHLALGAIVRAGLEGLLADLPDPPLVEGDPALLDPAVLERLGLRRLPGSLPEALDALLADPLARAWQHPEALESYLGTKRAELRLVETLAADALCARYAEVY